MATSKPAPESYSEVLDQWKHLLLQTEATTDTATWWTQLSIAAIALLLAFALGKRIVSSKGSPRLIGLVFGKGAASENNRYVVVPAVATALLWLSFLLFEPFYSDHCVYLRGVALCTTIWFVFDVVFRLFKDRHGFQIALVGFFLWALSYILDIHSLVSESLDLVAFSQGSFRISLRDILYGIAYLSGLFWISGLIARIIDQKVNSSTSLSVSSKVLFSKLAHIILFTLAILVSLRLMGFDLGSLTFFSGALGIGLGFGSQKIIANFVSGLILLIEKSVKPGDFVLVDGECGQVKKLNTRYTTILSKGSQEHLVPNEDLVTNQVISFSHSDNNFSIRAEIGVGYDSDPNQVIELCCKAMRSIDRVCGEPSCHLLGFGDSSIDFRLTFTIEDPINGIASARSAVLLAVWDEFKANGIQIPFPQREVRILGGDPSPIS
jgi:small-conductance mechanosensitive channel